MCGARSAMLSALRKSDVYALNIQSSQQLALLHQNCASCLNMDVHVRCSERSFRNATGSAEDAAQDGE